MKYYSAWFIVFLLSFFVLPKNLNMKIILFGIFTLFLSALYYTNVSPYYSPLVYFQKQNSDFGQKGIKVHDILKKKLIISKTKKTFIVHHDRVPLPYSGLDGLNLKTYIFWPNLSEIKFDQDPDYIITHSEGIEHMTESDFENMAALASPKFAKIYRNTRKELLRLINKGKFRGASFKKETIENVVLFTRVRPAI